VPAIIRYARRDFGSEPDRVASHHVKLIEGRIDSRQRLTDELHAVISPCHGGHVAQ
jgi:hypothetical protein